MQIDTEHLHYWMQAIRQSSDPMRTMDAFWSGQLKSKEWLINSLAHVIYPERNKELDFPISVDVHGGWVGTLASMLFQSVIPIKHIRSIDIDPSCESIATVMNKKEEIEGRFRAVTADMCTIRSDTDVVINTSCEHITQDQYDLWLSGMPYNTLFALQSNNYDIPEHIRIAKNLDEFKKQSGLGNILYAGELNLPKYCRFMIIGKK
jgi:hypothetical protein